MKTSVIGRNVYVKQMAFSLVHFDGDTRLSVRLELRFFNQQNVWLIAKQQNDYFDLR